MIDGELRSVLQDHAINRSLLKRKLRREKKWIPLLKNEIVSLAR
jgi:hypothetical protein